ncbi:MAG: hypothetical protein KGY39_04755 [Anaerolineales bacterium]|nr:hypothetical protein [Anaerolineales bacterium]
MIYPKEEVVYENMNTSFTNFGELLSDLKQNSFTGSVQISFWEYEGNLFIDNGNVVNAVEEIEGERATGKKAVKRLLDKTKEKGGSISVYALKENMVTVLSSVVQSELLFGDLSTEFTSIQGLINKLRKEDQTGYVEVVIGDDSKKGFIYFLSGEIINCLLTNGGQEVSGLNILPRIMDAASSQGATFNVYKAAIEESFAEGEEIRISNQFPQLLEIWGIVIQAVETEVDELLEEGEFLKVLKEVMIDHAEEYPFLDPFAAKFHYYQGEIEYHGNPEKRLSQGVGICLRDTIERLEKENPEKAIHDHAFQGLIEVKEEHMGVITNLGIGDHIPG